MAGRYAIVSWVQFEISGFELQPLPDFTEGSGSGYGGEASGGLVTVEASGGGVAMEGSGQLVALEGG